MTNLVLTHTGSAVPEYVETCIRQLQHTNPDITIDLIADYNHGNNFIEDTKLACVNVIPIQELESDHVVKRFRELSWFKAWGKPNTHYPSPDNFVQGTSERLFLLAAYLKESNIKNVWHIENDNLIYNKFEIIEHHLSTDKITCCYMNNKHTVWNLVFIPDPSLLYTAMEWYAYMLSKGNEWLCKTYDLEMAHEMTIMRQYEDLSFFPSLPIQEGTIEGYYFDPASYGQYIGGTNNGHPPGFRDTVNHDIGRSFGTLWTDAYFNEEMKRPFVVSPDTEKLQHIKNAYPLFNLHVHNKYKMKELKSYD